MSDINKKGKRRNVLQVKVTGRRYVLYIHMKLFVRLAL